MIHTYVINGLSIKTGDLICTTDGEKGYATGQYWRLIGMFLPGDIDHIVIYVGPKGKCVEAGASMRVIDFEVENNIWDARKMYGARKLIDSFYGIAYPLADKGKSADDETNIRAQVGQYCLTQVGKPYNLNFFNSQTEEAFYCSQLAYKAYKQHGVDLNSGLGIPNIPWTESIIYPQEVWEGCKHVKV